MTKNASRDDAIRQSVRASYAAVARGAGGCCGSAAPSATPCCAPAAADRSARAIGYSAADLGAMPAGANLGLGCGNPTAIAGLKPGETVLDLGAGAGLDCFLAARRVGPEGKVIGVDMTPEMVARARANAAADGVANVEFRLGEIEHLPVADASIDVILSNCVINLSPTKAEVFREAFRVLRPGGRLCVSDVVATAPLPKSLAESDAAICGCVGGAASAASIEGWLRDAGFADVRVAVNEATREVVAGWAPGGGAEGLVAAAVIEARKPERATD